MTSLEQIAARPVLGNLGSSVIRIRGKNTVVPSIEIADRKVVATGKILRLAQVFDEELVKGEAVPNPSSFIASLRSSALKADIFTFAQRPPDTVPKFSARFEWDNWAIASTLSSTAWWKHLPQESRKNARRAIRKGVTVHSVPFDAAFVRGIQEIYNETPIRQGKKFWHFGKDFETVKMENETYLERSEFIGAFHKDDLIGFIKIVYVDRLAILIQILAKNEHQDKRPMNALVAQAIKTCEEKHTSCLVYGKYVYGTKHDSSLTEFKRRNGFTQINFPRYYVPLSSKGRIALNLGLHHGRDKLIPKRINNLALGLRAWIARNTARASERRSADCV